MFLGTKAEGFEHCSAFDRIQNLYTYPEQRDRWRRVKSYLNGTDALQWECQGMYMTHVAQATMRYGYAIHHPCMRFL